MRFPNYLFALSVVGAAACGPTYVVQGPPPGPAPQRAPEPPRVPPLEVSIVRSEEGRVLLQTSRQAYVAVFEIVPGRGVSLVYPSPMRPRNVQYTGLSWINVYWTMRPDYRYASSETRYIYAIASDTPLRLEDDDYDARRMERSLGSLYRSSSPNATVRAIAREFVRAQPDEWWGEDMTSMTVTNNRINVVIRLARVYCPDGNVFEVRDDLIDRVWCPARRGGPRVGERPGAAFPDSVFNSTGRRVPRRMDPTARTPIFRVPAGTDVGQQQGQPTNQPQNQPRNGPPSYPHTQPQTPPQTPAGNNPQTPPQNQPPQNQPPQNQPPQTQPPQTQPPQTPPPQNQPPQNPPSTQDPNGNDKDHQNNGRRAHGDPQNADPRGNGNGYGNGGRNTPATQPPTTSAPPTVPAASNPQPQQQGQPQSPTSNNGQGQSQSHGNGNGNDNGKANGNQNPGNSASDHGKSPNEAKPDHNDAPKTGVAAILAKRAPQPKQDKKAPADSTDKKKP